MGERGHPRRPPGTLPRGTSDGVAHGPEGRLPDFVIIGAMKAGTTSLFRWLGQQDGCSLGVKEPHFFSRDEVWRRGLAWYAALFAGVPSGAITGEASADYADVAWSATVARRMRSLVPRARIVYLVRHPLDRLRSHYRHEVQRGRERRPLDVALREPDSPYVRRSLYAACLGPFAEAFPRDQVLVVRFEDLIGDDPAAWHSVLDHLGLARADRPREAHNESREKPGYSRAMRWMFDHGVTPRLRRVPGPVRGVGRRVLLRRGARYQRRIARGAGPIPTGVADLVWSDVDRLEDRLGLDRPLWAREDPVAG